MKNPLLIAAVCAVVLTFASPGHARQWTSAGDASRTFEAELIDARDGKVTVRRKSGLEMTFPLTKLSEADRTYVAQEIEARRKAAADDELKDAPIPKELAGKLVKRSGGKLTKYDLSSRGAVPKYYLIYYSASW
jgi:hypothetical protein